MHKFISTFLLSTTTILGTPAAWGDEVGEVSTKFRLASPNDKIIVEAFDDPRIPGATCYLSHARKGGLSGAIGIAEDTSDASIACRQTGKLSSPRGSPMVMMMVKRCLKNGPLCSSSPYR